MQNIFQNIFFNILVVEGENEKNEKILNGDMTEKALYNYMIDNGYEKNNILNYGNENKNKNKEKYVLNFNSDNKFMCTLIKENSNNYKLYLKGAHEIVFPLLTTIKNNQNKNDSFNKYKNEISKIIQKYSKESKRILIFASKT